jgi:hypothetical protein
MERHFGWVRNPVEVEAVMGRLARPLFFASAAGSYAGAVSEQAYLWKAAEQILGHQLPGRNQGQVGSCVSFGTASAIEHTMLTEIMAGQPEEFRELCQEEIYGGSRVEIGRNQISGDGSIGAWAAEFVTKYGVLARAVYDSLDLTKYSESRCRDWGRNGVPDLLEPECRKHPVKTASLVRNWDEAKKALSSGFGIAVSSDRGFTMTRDQDGFAKPLGEWGHCMGLIGYQTGRREGGFLLNSWGDDAHTGPSGAGDPPPSGFWADASVVEKMLKQGDSWAFSAVDGFPLRRIHWLI